jgi:hypothetical protein
MPVFEKVERMFLARYEPAFPLPAPLVELIV